MEEDRGLSLHGSDSGPIPGVPDGPMSKSRSLIVIECKH